MITPDEDTRLECRNVGTWFMNSNFSSYVQTFLSQIVSDLSPVCVGNLFVYAYEYRE